MYDEAAKEMQTLDRARPANFNLRCVSTAADTSSSKNSRKCLWTPTRLSITHLDDVQCFDITTSMLMRALLTSSLRNSFAPAGRCGGVHSVMASKRW